MLTSPLLGQIGPLILPEQQCLPGRHPQELCQLPLPNVPPPRTVDAPGKEIPPDYMSLDEAIRIALQNAEVIRVLAGVGAANSGNTVYDPAVAVPAIDEAQSIFDPQVTVNNTWTNSEPPVAFFDPSAPNGVSVGGTRTGRYDLSVDVSKQQVTGGVARLLVNADQSRFSPGTFALNPNGRGAAELSYVQPLLSGRGRAVNLAPVVLARIDTERSYFQLKDSVQELVRGVVNAYWSLVFARTDVWAREQQVEQGQFAYDRSKASQEVGSADLADVAQSRLALASFRAGLVSANANLIAQEAALRNILGLPPTDTRRLVPTTPPTDRRIGFDWSALLDLAQRERPDIIELKLVLEADQQQILLAQNNSRPQLDAVALYRWNGIEGETPNGSILSVADGSSTDWTLGVNFSVPLGLRQGRAGLRRQELLLARDRANLTQQLHATTHILAANLRNLAQFYAQYEAFRITREAARDNLEAQLAEYLSNRTAFLNVLQAITDWGNAVSNEASALTQYNTELANLERQTGTILQTHGVRFFEERYCSVGPIGFFSGKGRMYPKALQPSENENRYRPGDRPSEEAFNLDNPVKRPFRLDDDPTVDRELLRLPPPAPEQP